MRREDLDAGPDVTEDEEMAGEMEVVARIEHAQKPEPWEIRDVRENKTGVYYTVSVKTIGGLNAPVTVKHSTRFDTFCCLTCNTHNRCKHSRFVKRWVQNHGARVA